jgi:hypothetical protein
MSVLATPAIHEYYTELANALPPPISDKPEHRERRLATAIDAFQALHPGDAYEARLAVQIVLSGAHAVECLVEAGIYREDFAKRYRCRAQANSLMREERAAKRSLAQEQKLRLATEAVAGPTLARPAVASAPPPVADVRAAPPPQVQSAEATSPIAPALPPAGPQRPAATQVAPQPAAAGSVPPPSPEAIAQAEAFMVEDSVAAAQIRHDHGVTPLNKAYFHEVTFPTDPAVIDALVRGTSELLTMLDDVGGEDLDEAA